ncbi:MAG: hypothetical protein WDN69_17550 [Aliidongia sp.]
MSNWDLAPIFRQRKTDAIDFAALRNRGAAYGSAPRLGQSFFVGLVRLDLLDQILEEADDIVAAGRLYGSIDRGLHHHHGDEVFERTAFIQRSVLRCLPAMSGSLVVHGLHIRLIVLSHFDPSSGARRDASPQRRTLEHFIGVF